MDLNIGAPTREQMNRYEALLERLRNLGCAVVAFSGGVDSTFLLYAAREALGGNVLAATASSATFPERELKETEAFCQANGIRQIVFPSEELSVEGFAHNPKNRCYLCKRELFGKILNIQREEGIATVLEGSNIDDTGDYRPGLQAVAELGILSPPAGAWLYKAGHPNAFQESWASHLEQTVLRLLVKSLSLRRYHQRGKAQHGGPCGAGPAGYGFYAAACAHPREPRPCRTAPEAVSPVHGGTKPTEGCTGLQGDWLCLHNAGYFGLSYWKYE